MHYKAPLSVLNSIKYSSCESICSDNHSLQHDLTEEFYTSDYDLSGFESYEGGLELRLNSLAKTARLNLDELGLRYSYYKRSDGLHAHTFTFLTQFQFRRKQH